MNKHKVVVIVNGGSVTEVYANHEYVDVHIVEDGDSKELRSHLKRTSDCTDPYPLESLEMFCSLVDDPWYNQLTTLRALAKLVREHISSH